MQQSAQYDICILGSANSDLFLNVQEFPRVGETINASNSYIKNGGKGANQAVASALLGSNTVFAGQMGKDSLADILINEMKDSGLDLSGLRQIDNVQTGQAIIMLDQNGDNIIVIIGGANMEYSNQELPQQFRDILDKSVFLQLQREVPQFINTEAAKYLKQKEKFVMLDCGGRNEPFQKELLENLTFISPNETELERIIECRVKESSQDFEQDLIDLVREKLLSQHPHLQVLLKLGSQGSMMVTKDVEVVVPTVVGYNKSILNDFKIIDTVGAGDCFTSGFFTALNERLKNQNIKSPKELLEQPKEKLEKLYKESMQFASAAAFLCITRQGAMPSMPKRKEVDEFMAKYLPK